jgi:pimeloyl-ACP methyl ester carboxylesterase
MARDQLEVMRRLGFERWRRRAPRFTGQVLDCGHFLAEERPEEVTRALTGFLARTSAGGQVTSKLLVPGRRKV